MNSLFPDDVRQTKTRAKKPRTRTHNRRRAWEDSVRPQVFATDLATPAEPVESFAASVELPARTVLADLSDAQLDALIAGYRERRAAVYADRYAARLSVHLPTDADRPVDFVRAITELAQAYKEEMLASQGCRFAAKGVYQVRPGDPSSPYRAQIWVPAQPASPGRPAKPGYHKNLRLHGTSTHMKTREEAWLAVAKYYEEEEGIDVDVNPPKDSAMAELIGLIREAAAMQGHASGVECGDDE